MMLWSKNAFSGSNWEVFRVNRSLQIAGTGLTQRYPGSGVGYENTLGRIREKFNSVKNAFLSQPRPETSELLQLIY